ncbi:MAG: sulfurtransferase TusA family protein [Rhodospirillales bacterium]|nr:sulfurtransferase TusA family protein [Rhodospirillales bacterium]
MEAVDIELDTRGLNCPMPILKMRKVLEAAKGGEVIKMFSSDPGSVTDMDSFCRQTGNTLLSSDRQGGDFIYVVKKV